MAGCVYLAWRDATFLGAGERLEDAQELCETRAAKRGEGLLRWDARRVRDLLADDGAGQVIVEAGRYVVRRVPVTRQSDGDGC